MTTRGRKRHNPEQVVRKLPEIQGWSIPHTKRRKQTPVSDSDIATTIICIRRKWLPDMVRLQCLTGA